MKCWYCRKAKMVDTDDGFHPFKKCPECGATWTELPKPTFYGLVVERVDEITQETKYRPRKRRVSHA